MKRIFIGLPIDELWSRLLGTLREPHPGIRWISDQNLHLTVQYLGPTPEVRIEPFITRLRQLRSDPIILDVDKLVCFPRLRQARVLALALQPSERFASLCGAVRQAAEDVDFVLQPARISPHITVARIKSADTSWLRDYLDSHSGRVWPQFHYSADQFHLYESTLTRRGAKYSIMHSFPLTDR